MGSTSVLAAGGGTEVPGSRARYYPFGSPRTAPTQTITDRNFTGRKENLELGLIYFNARYYLPTLARFLTPDTLVPDPQNPQQFNRYTYALNNPLRFTDPSGHCVYDSNPNIDDPYVGDAQCWSLLWGLERSWGIDIQDEYIWTLDYLQSLSKVLGNFADFMGGANALRALLQNSAKGNKFIIRGTMGDWYKPDDPTTSENEESCPTGCNIPGQIRLNLTRIFAFSPTEGSNRLGRYYREQPGNGELTMAHELAHIFLGEFPDFLTNYVAARGWHLDSGQWKDKDGNSRLMFNPAEHLTHAIALYVSAGNTWSKVESRYIGYGKLINPLDMSFVNTITLTFHEPWQIGGR